MSSKEGGGWSRAWSAAEASTSATPSRSTDRSRSRPDVIRAVDLHVHLPRKEWLDGSMGPYREGAARYFRSEVHERSVDELAVDFAQEQLFGILLAWDAQTAAARPPLSNDFVSAIVKRHPKRCAFFASVDPWKPNAGEELERAVRALGGRGAKSHPSRQDRDSSEA